jgi:mono/diheme cytochrome c family protein
LIRPLLDNPVLETQLTSAEPETSVRPRRLALTLLAIVGTFVVAIAFVTIFRPPDPYIGNVLRLQGSAAQGQVIFQMNCATCHGITGDGMVGPSLRHVSSRKSRVGLIEQVISGKTPPMPQFQPNPQEMADLLGYLESL